MRQVEHVRRKGDEAFWSLRLGGADAIDLESALVLTDPYRREAAGTQAEVARLWQEAAASGDLGDLDDEGPVPEGANHGRTLFAAFCAGSLFFDRFCAPFLASFELAYGVAAYRHRVVMFVSNVDRDLLEHAGKRFGPWCLIAPLDHKGAEAVYGAHREDDDSLVCGVVEGLKRCDLEQVTGEDRKRQVDFRDTMLQDGILRYLEGNEHDFCFIVFMDADMLFVRPLGKYLSACEAPTDRGGRGSAIRGGVDWDVGFTAYDENFTTPWADDVTDVARTQGGYTRFNSGLVLINYRKPDAAKLFLRTWAKAHDDLLAAQRGDLGPATEAEVANLLKVFRGTSQAALVAVLTSYDTGRMAELLGWKACRACHESVPVAITDPTTGASMQVRFRALKARELNHAESLLNDGVFPEELLVVHLKGSWWRQVVYNDAYGMRRKTRRALWNVDTLFLHRLALAVWHQALPQELLLRYKRKLRIDLVSESLRQPAAGGSGGDDE